MNRGLSRLGLCLAAAGLLFFGKGTWMVAKARLAQVLLARSWHETRAGAGPVRPWPWADTWPVARLLVPALGVDEIVLDGASGRTLAFAPGHLDGSAPPAGPGNTVLAGHRDTHFRFLRDLQPGMLLIVEAADGRRRRYRVTATRVVDKRRTDVAEATAQPTLTLITCYPFDAVAPGGPLRYVVQAVGVDATPPPTQRAAAAPPPASSPPGGHPAGGL
jgi:sortase A